MRSTSLDALEDLFEVVSARGARAIVTFPSEGGSNGLTGEMVEDAAKEFFKVRRKVVPGRLSTLGGNLKHRAARHYMDELILVLSPR
jgi:adenine-specific DNA-methyltransferase